MFRREGERNENAIKIALVCSVNSLKRFITVKMKTGKWNMCLKGIFLMDIFFSFVRACEGQGKSECCCFFYWNFLKNGPNRKMLIGVVSLSKNKFQKWSFKAVDDWNCWWNLFLAIINKVLFTTPWIDENKRKKP